MKPITAWQVANAFPDCKKDVERNIRIVKKRLKPFLNEVDNARQKFIDDHERGIVIEMLKIQAPEDFKLYQNLLKIKDFMKNAEYGQTMADVENANQVPIESLYVFDNKRKRGRNIYASCPFHNDKTPSFVIFGYSNRFYCFGCHACGDSIEFVRKAHGKTFREAVNWLCGK